MNPFKDFDTGVGWAFGLTIDGIEIQGIEEVTGVKMELDNIEVHQQTPQGKYVIKQLPGRRKAGEMTFTRPLTGDTSFSDWIEKVYDKGDVTGARKNGTVVVYKYEGAEEVMSFEFQNAWPKMIEYGSFKAGDTEHMTEKLTVVYEDLQRKK